MNLWKGVGHLKRDDLASTLEVIFPEEVVVHIRSFYGNFCGAKHHSLESHVELLEGLSSKNKTSFDYELVLKEQIVIVTADSHPCLAGIYTPSFWL